MVMLRVLLNSREKVSGTYIYPHSGRFSILESLGVPEIEKKAGVLFSISREKELSNPFCVIGAVCNICEISYF